MAGSRHARHSIMEEMRAALSLRAALLLANIVGEATSGIGEGGLTVKVQAQGPSTCLASGCQSPSTKTLRFYGLKVEVVLKTG